MHIGKVEKVVVGVPKPEPMRRFTPPPEREPVLVPIRRKEEPKKRALQLLGEREEGPLGLTEDTTFCPICGRLLEEEDGILYCPEHGLVSNWERY